jgi:hypothetical protein
LLHSNRLNGCGACVRTDVFRQVGGFDGRFWPADAYHLWLRIAVEHRIADQPGPLGRYRYYSGQASAARLRMALVELGAKLDFLRRHRQVRRQLGRTLIRQAVEDPFFATLQRWHAAGQQRAAAPILLLTGRSGLGWRAPGAGTGVVTVQRCSNLRVENLLGHHLPVGRRSSVSKPQPEGTNGRALRPLQRAVSAVTGTRTIG